MSPRRWLLVGVLALTAAIGPRAAAQPADGVQPTREELELQISIMRDYIKKLEQAAAPSAAVTVDPAVLKAYNDAQLKQYESLSRQADLINESFYEQRIMLRTTLFLVALVVIAGVSFSAIQLWQGLRAAGAPLSNELEISASKVRLTSSVIGVVVLTISLAFFYVFVSSSLRIERAGASLATTQAPK
jgi:hypothetical protein